MNPGQKTCLHVHPDKGAFLKLAQATMPYGKYAGCPLVDLPEPYVVWLSRKGFPEGELGELLRTVYEIKVNGLEYLFKPSPDPFPASNPSTPIERIHPQSATQIINPQS